MKQKTHSSVLNLAYIALFTAMIAVCTWVSIPIGPIQITLQTMAVCIAAGMLGTWRSICSIAVYIALGAVGLPVFSGFEGGLGKIAGPTGGYMVGFFFTALTVGGAAALFGRKWYVLIPSMIMGIAVCYAFGTAWFLILMGGKYTLGAAISACVLPFIVPDLLKVAVATALVSRLSKVVRL